MMERELFYLVEGGKLMSADINTEGGFQSGVPRELFQANIKYRGQGVPYDVRADGQAFLVNIYSERHSAAPMTIVLNWTATLNP